MMGHWLPSSLAMTFRVAAISLGGYALTAGLCSLAGMVLMLSGMAMPDAMLTTVLVGYIFYIALVMWAFADRVTMKRPWAILIAAILTTIATSVLGPLVLS